MPAGFDIKINSEQLAALQVVTAGIKNGAPRALSQAINKTLTGAQTDMVQQVYETYNLTKTRIRQNFFKWNTNANDIHGYVRARGKPIKFVESGTFNFSSTALQRGGVSAKIKRGASTTKWLYAFPAIMPNGHVGFFQREYRAKFATGKTTYNGIPATKLPWKRFYPGKEDPHRKLTELTGPAVEDAFSTRTYPTAMPTVENKVKKRLDDNIAYQIDYELSKF